MGHLWVWPMPDNRKPFCCLRWGKGGQAVLSIPITGSMKNSAVTITAITLLTMRNVYYYDVYDVLAIVAGGGTGFSPV